MRLQKLKDASPEKLREYAEQFYGYGSWRNGIWLVGPEERGCVTDPMEFCKRLRAWSSFDTRDVVDLREFHHKRNYETGFEIDWSSTVWEAVNSICRLAGFDIEPLGKKNSTWGRVPRNSSPAGLYVSLIEASPFPVPSARPENWPYKPEELLLSRGKELNDLIERRLQRLVEKIDTHAPALVIAHSVTVKGMMDMLQERGWIRGSRIDRAEFLLHPTGSSVVCHIKKDPSRFVNHRKVADAIIDARERR